MSGEPPAPGGRLHESDEYTVVQTPRFERSFRKLRAEFQRRIAEQILTLEVQPRTEKPLQGQLKGLFSLRVGDYKSRI
jgi:mRNA-degrading endonuclease RelE of RelBE toxin-antitoxin system